jgi:hypothetical protein
MNTADLMQVALDLGGFTEIPADSGIWVEGDHLRRVLVGIDVGAAELLMARQLGFDAVVAHHPVKRQGFWKVFERHRELMRAAGLPDDVIRTAIESRADSLRLAEHNTNDDHTVSVARLLGMPLINCHLPLDEYTRQVLIRTVATCQAANPAATAGDIAAAIGELPSFQRSWLKPMVAHGSPEAPAGRVVASIAAGTNGGFAVAEAYLTHGYDTVIYMHIQPEDRERLRREAVRGSVVITGHGPADSIGVDAFVQELRRRGLEVETFSGVDTPVEL